MKNSVKRFLLSVWPHAANVWAGLNLIIGRKPSFFGWGMTTHSIPPWHSGGGTLLVKEFNDIHRRIVAEVTENNFRSPFFAQFPDIARLLNELMWRHFVVFWTARYSVSKTGGDKNLVECGVGEGLTAYFAINAVKDCGYNYRFYLYDSWEAMKEEYLLPSEKCIDYSWLELHNTQNNLVEYKNNCVFNKGFIPESFCKSENPDSLVWLHIDLNSSLPTKGSLDFFYEKLQTGGLILFDDYGWPGYKETKELVDMWFEGKNGMLFPIPTGQSIFFKF